MAGGKSIILLILFLNIFSLIFAFACEDQNSTVCGEFNKGSNPTTSVLTSLFSVEDNLSNSGGVDYSDTTKSNLTALTTPASGLGQTIATFIDVAKMALGMLSLLTPFPIIAFFIALGLPGWITLLLAAPLALLYIMALTEFWKGGTL